MIWGENNGVLVWYGVGGVKGGGDRAVAPGYSHSQYIVTIAKLI